MPDAGRPEPGLAGELRDTELAITFWHQKASEFGGLPPLTAFDFSQMISGPWSHRFVICADAVAGEPAFLIYGSRLAQMLELPEKPISGFQSTGNSPGDICRFLSRAVVTQSRAQHPSG
jgi:hypothetical protein